MGELLDEGDMHSEIFKTHRNQNVKMVEAVKIKNKNNTQLGHPMSQRDT